MKKVTAEKVRQVIPTYIPKKANDLPMFFENKPYQGASGRLYPIPYFGVNYRRQHKHFRRRSR